MVFYDKRAGIERGYAVSDEETITAIQDMIAANGKPELPQKISRALALCLARQEKEGFEFVWRANAEFGRKKGASEEQLKAAYSRLATKFRND
jgi:hypothetical protein